MSRVTCPAVTVTERSDSDNASLTLRAVTITPSAAVHDGRRSAPANRRATVGVPPNPAVLARLAIGGEGLLITGLPPVAGAAPTIRVRWTNTRVPELTPVELAEYRAAVARVDATMRRRFGAPCAVEVES